MEAGINYSSYSQTVFTATFSQHIESYFSLSGHKEEFQLLQGQILTSDKVN